MKTILGLVVVLALIIAVRLRPASAQAGGTISRPACTSIAHPVIGQSFCLEQTATLPKVPNGAAWAESAPRILTNVRDYGAKGDNRTDDTTAIQEAINALKTPGMVVFPPGTYRYSTLRVTVDGIMLVCPSMFTTTLRTTSATADAITFANDLGGGIDGCNLDASSVRTAGALVRVKGATARTVNQNFRFTNNKVTRGFIGLAFDAAYIWTVVNNYVTASVSIGIQVQNTVNADQGDSQIIGNVIASTTGSGIKYISSGGLKIIGNKINNHPIGIDMVLNGTTGVLVIAGNSIENNATASISLQRSAGSFNDVTITGNQLSPSVAASTAIAMGKGKWLTDLVISANAISLSSLGRVIGIDCHGANGAYISGNVIDARNNTTASTGINVGTASCAGLAVGPNKLHSLITPVANPGAATDLVIIESGPTGFTFAQIPATLGNGSLIYCRDCTMASPCAGGGTGAYLKRLNGVNVCN